MMMALQSLVSLAVTLMTLAALILLWRQSKSSWLIVSIVAECVSLLCRAMLFVAPELFRSTSVFSSVWTLSALAFATGLLGYAIETTQRR
jgi:hypothetical protein